MIGRGVRAAVIWSAVAAVLLFVPLVSSATTARGVISVEGSDGLGDFDVEVDSRELPSNLASSENYFGRPTSHRHTGSKRDPDCLLRWRARRVTMTFFHGYGGVRSSCAPAAGTRSAEFGAGWGTDTGLQVGAPLADLKAAYPEATRHGSVWGLIESHPPWGGTIDVLAARARGGRVRALLVAGPEAWDE